MGRAVWVPAMMSKQVSALLTLALVLMSAACHSAVPPELIDNRAHESNRQESPARPSPTPTPENVAPVTQDEIAREASKEGYRIHKGRYVNEGYGFTALIPEGYVGIKDPEPNPTHGFRIVLARRPEAEIRVYGNYDAANYSSLDEAVNAQLKYLGKDPNNTEIHVLSRERAKLQNLPAARIVARYKHQDSATTMIQDLLVSIRWEKFEGEEEPWVLYILLLRTGESRYNTDREIFERVVSTWRARPLER